MKAKIRYDRHFEIGRVDRRMAGSFVEHLNRCVYGGIYEPGHPTVDSAGFRGDVKKMIRDAGVSLLRYPGGNFVSSYDWKDGIGPVSERPVKYDLAWGCAETNQVGTDEFARYAGELGAELMMGVNMGTGTPKEAAELVEYCNVDRGTFYSDLRRQNGSEQPYRVRLWCIGNEMDGSWQMGQMNARDYAVKYREAAKMMRSVDPEITLIACGSCSNEPGHRSFGVWDRTVLEENYEWIDYLSLHRYYGYDVEQDLPYLHIETLRDGPWMAKDLEEMICTVSAAIDYVKGIHHSKHQVFIAFDELSILPHRVRHSSGIVCDRFSQYDAVLYGGLLCTLLNHADRVRINCQALLVNENGMILTFPMTGAIPQTILYPFRDIAGCTGGTVLVQSGKWPEIETEHFGSVPCAAASCVYQKETGELKVLVANQSLTEELELELSFGGFREVVPLEHVELYTDEPHDRSFERTEVQPVVRMMESADSVTLRPHSWNVLRYAVKEE